MVRRPFVVALLLVLTVSLAGCSFRDWYNQEGTVTVALRAVDASDSDLESFKSLRIGFHSVQIRQLDSADPVSDVKQPPEAYDLVRLAQTGPVELLSERTNLRGFISVNVKIEAINGTTADGDELLGCEQGVRVEEPPCIRYAARGNYPLTLDPETFRVPRGGELTVVVPIGVRFDATTNEFFLFSLNAEAVEG